MDAQQQQHLARLEQELKELREEVQTIAKFTLFTHSCVILILIGWIVFYR